MPQAAPKRALDLRVQEVPLHVGELIHVLHIEGIACLQALFFTHDRHSRAGEKLRDIEVEVRLLLHMHADILDVCLRVHQLFEFLDRDLVGPILIEIAA